MTARRGMTYSSAPKTMPVAALTRCTRAYTLGTRHRLVDLSPSFAVPVVSEPALYVEPGVGAAVEHGGHVAAQQRVGGHPLFS
jgi:hypothetical protein